MIQEIEIQSRSHDVFVAWLQKWHSISSTIFYWSHGTALVQREQGLHKHRSTRRQGSLGAVLGKAITWISGWHYELFYLLVVYLFACIYTLKEVLFHLCFSSMISSYVCTFPQTLPAHLSLLWPFYFWLNNNYVMTVVAATKYGNRPRATLRNTQSI